MVLSKFLLARQTFLAKRKNVNNFPFFLIFCPLQFCFIFNLFVPRLKVLHCFYVSVVYSKKVDVNGLFFITISWHIRLSSKSMQQGMHAMCLFKCPTQKPTLMHLWFSVNLGISWTWIRLPSCTWLSSLSHFKVGLWISSERFIPYLKEIILFS